MKFFYLSTQLNTEGKFEVHERDCDLIPSAYDRDYLGPFNSGKEAISKASSLKSNATLCPNCSSTSYVAVFSRLKKQDQ